MKDPSRTSFWKNQFWNAILRFMSCGKTYSWNLARIVYQETLKFLARYSICIKNLVTFFIFTRDLEIIFVPVTVVPGSLSNNSKSH